MLKGLAMKMYLPMLHQYVITLSFSPIVVVVSGKGQSTTSSSKLYLKVKIKVVRALGSQPDTLDQGQEPIL